MANSRKNYHRCVAGIEQLPNNYYRWVRPVGNRDGRGVTLPEIALEDGSQPQPLDVLEVSLIEPVPSGNHQEDWLLDANVRWRKVGRYSWQQAALFTPPPGLLWIDGHQSGSGINDYVPEPQASGLPGSLRLVHAKPVIHVQTAYDPNRRPNVRASFRHAGQDYRLKVTDSVVEEKFRAKGINDYPLGESILTISLSESWQQPNSQQWQQYKLVAALIEKYPV